MDPRYLFGIMALAMVKVSSDDQPDGIGNEVAPKQEKSANQSGNSMNHFILHRRQASQFLQRQNGWWFFKSEEEKHTEDIEKTRCRLDERDWREVAETNNEGNEYIQEAREEGKIGQVKTRMTECEEKSGLWG